MPEPWEEWIPGDLKLAKRAGYNRKSREGVMKILTVVCLSLLPLAAGARGGQDKNPDKARVGMMAPDLPLERGKHPISVASFRGKPVLIHVWASWCGPCKVSMPEFKQIAESFNKTDLVVLMVDRDNSPQEARMFLIKEQITWPDYHDGDKHFEKAFGRGEIPATILVDRDGVVRYRHSGAAMGEDRAQKLMHAIAKAVAKPVGAQAGTSEDQP